MQVTSVGLLIEINPVHNLILYFFKTHFVILPSVPSCLSFFLIQLRRQRKCTLNYPPISSLWFDYCSGVWCWIQVMTLLLILYSSVSFHLPFYVQVFLISLFWNALICLLLLTLYRLSESTFLSNIPWFPKERCLFGTFPNFSHLSFW
jgi:hypothetical protein